MSVESVDDPAPVDPGRHDKGRDRRERGVMVGREASEGRANRPWSGEASRDRTPYGEPRERDEGTSEGPRARETR